MASRLFACLLTAALIVTAPGLDAWVAFAETKIELDQGQGQLQQVHLAAPTQPSATPSHHLLRELRNNAELQKRVPQEQIDHAIQLVERYQSSLDAEQSDPDAAKALEAAAKDLDNKALDPNLALAQLFDRLTTRSREADNFGMSYHTLESSADGKRSVTAVHSGSIGKILFIQSQQEIGPKIYRKVITRPHPDNPDEVEIDVVFDQYEQDAAIKQRIRYNRRVQLMFLNMEKTFYDQTPLARKIEQNCEKGKAKTPPKDEGVTDAICGKLVAYFEKQRADFDEGTKFSGKNLRDYIDEVEKHKADGTLEQLKWEELEGFQRRALEYYNKYQLETMQKMVLMQLTAYFSQVTNTQPKQKKEEAAIDGMMKSPEEINEVLAQFKSGSYAGLSHIARAAGWGELDPEDPHWVDPKILAAAAEAFANISFAVKAKERILHAGTGEEKDAAIEESQGWLKLAQIQLQTFELGTMRIQLERLRDRKLRDGLGVRADNSDGMHARIQELLKQNDAYLEALEKSTLETKGLLLRQAVAAFWLTHLNATAAYYWEDTMQQRLKTLLAKSTEIRELYLALEFDKRKKELQEADFRKLESGGRLSMEDKLLHAALYQRFLDNLPEDVAAVVADIDAFALKLAPLLNLRSVEAIRPELDALEAQFRGITRRVLGEGKMPDLAQVQKESQALGVKHTKLFQAVQTFSSNLRLFDMVNELDLYIIHYASSQGVDSENQGAMTKIMKAVDGFMSRITGGQRDAVIEQGLKRNPLTSEAWKRLGENEGKRKQVLSLLAAGDFNGAIKIIVELDPEAAQKAMEEYDADKQIEDPFQELDFDSFTTKAPQSREMAAVQGVMNAQFKHLQAYIVGYTATAAVVDTVIMSVLTAGVAQVGNYALQATRVAITAARAAFVARFADASARISKMASSMAKAGNVMARIPVLGKIPGYVLRLGPTWGANIKNTFRLHRFPMRGGAANTATLVGKQFVNTAGASLKFHARMALTMAMFSSGITMSQHAWAGETSQFKGYGDAALQGAAGGASFGGKTGFLILLSPVSATAFRGTTGTVMRGIANTPGPITAMTNLVAKMAGRGGAIASDGLLGAAMGTQVALAGRVALRQAIRWGVWGGAMVDGAAKFLLFAELTKELAVAGYRQYHKKAGSYSGDEVSGGETQAMQALTDSMDFSLHVQEVSWLLLPTNPLPRAADMRMQNQAADGFANVVRQKGADAIYKAQEGDIIHYTKPWASRTLSERWKGQKDWTFQVTADARVRAERFVAARRGNAELLAVTVESADSHGRVIKVKQLLERLGFDKATLKSIDRNAKSKAQAPKEEAVGAGELRYTIESAEVNSRELTIRLRKDGNLRRDILSSGDHFELPDAVHGKITVKGPALARLREMAKLAHIERMRVTSWSPFSLARETGRRTLDIILDRPLETHYQTLVRRLAERVPSRKTSHELIEKVGEVVGRFMEARKGADKLAVQQLQRTLEKDVLLRVAEHIELNAAGHNAWFGKRWWRKLSKGAEARRKAEHEQAVDLLLDVWEQGMMGGKHARETTVDGKTTMTTPEEYQLQDLHGRAIPSFRAAQKAILREVLLHDGAGVRLQFAQMPTSAGKTLVATVMAERMHMDAIGRGKKGVMLLTVNQELVAQAKADYRAYNKGREPPYEIRTYEDLMAAITEAKANGSQSPMSQYDIVCDEFDKLAMGTPLSLGAFTGQLSFAKIDPLQLAMRAGIERIEGLHKKFGGNTLNENSIEHMLRSNKDFRGAFEAEIATIHREANAGRAKAATRDFRDSIDLSLYPAFAERFPNPAEARAQIQIAMLREHADALGGPFRLGVIEGQAHAGLKGWVRKIMKGAYILESHPDQSKVWMRDPTREAVLQLHNDTPYESLDTAYRSATEIKSQVPLTLDFNTVAITNFRELIGHAKNNGAKVFALSGTCADVIRKVLIEKYGFVFSGELTIPRPLEYVHLGKDASPFKTVASAAVATRVEMAKTGKKGTTYAWVESEKKLELLLEAAREAGIPPERISLRVYPTANLKEKQRWMEEVPKERNMEAFEAGQVDLVILVGAGGFRGLNNKHDAYAGGKITTYVIDPHTLPIDELTQLIGRTAPGRTEGVQTFYKGLVQLEAVERHGSYGQALNALLTRVQEAQNQKATDGPKWQGLLKGLSGGEPPKGAVEKLRADPKLINERVFFEEILALGKTHGPMSEAQAYEMLQVLKNPNRLTEKGSYDDCLAALKIRQSLKGASVAEMKALEAALREPKTREGLIEVLEREMQGLAQKEAISSSGILDALREEGALALP